jgi:hypothetical protein
MTTDPHMGDWLLILVMLPLVACLVVSAWATCAVFILWIAALMAAVLVAGVVFLLIERAAYYLGVFCTWLKDSLR